MKCSYTVDEKGVALLKINNPPFNSIDDQVLDELEECVNQIAEDAAARVVVIIGEGNAFVAGADIKKMQEVNTAEQAKEITIKAHNILNKIENSRKPYIAAINGLCLGGGTELALACHIRIAGTEATMGLPEISLGILPGFGGTQRLSRLLGPSRALEIMLTGKFIDMTEAEKIGLVNRVVPQAEIMNEAMKLAAKIASKGQVAVRAIIEAVKDGLLMSMKDGLAMERRLLGDLVESEDKQEGIAAFLEKRKPVFKDR